MSEQPLAVGNRLTRSSRFFLAVVSASRVSDRPSPLVSTRTPFWRLFFLLTSYIKLIFNHIRLSVPCFERGHSSHSLGPVTILDSTASQPPIGSGSSTLPLFFQEQERRVFHSPRIEVRRIFSQVSLCSLSVISKLSSPFTEGRNIRTFKLNRTVA